MWKFISLINQLCELVENGFSDLRYKYTAIGLNDIIIGQYFECI